MYVTAHVSCTDNVRESALRTDSEGWGGGGGEVLLHRGIEPASVFDTIKLRSTRERMSWISARKYNLGNRGFKDPVVYVGDRCSMETLR